MSDPSQPCFTVPDAASPNPMDDLLRKRLRVPVGADRRLKALRLAMGAVDWTLRTTTGQAFFGLREAEAALNALGDRTGPALVDKLLSMNGGTTITGHGLDHIPATGPVIIGSTHPVGTFDFVSHAAVLLQRRPDLKVVANREAEQFLGPEVIIPVDLDRSDKVLTARQTRAGMVSHLKSGGALLVFGSGRVANRARGLLFEPPWRNGVTRMSALSRAPIIPASPDMRNSEHYYRTRRLGEIASFGNEYFGRTLASLRYSSELLAKLGGRYEVHYGPALAPGAAPELIKTRAETLVPGLYVPS